MRSSFRSDFVYHALALGNRLSLSTEFIVLCNLGAQVVSYPSGHLGLFLIQGNCIVKEGGKPGLLHSSYEYNVGDWHPYCLHARAFLYDYVTTPSSRTSCNYLAHTSRLNSKAARET